MDILALYDIHGTHQQDDRVAGSVTAALIEPVEAILITRMFEGLDP